MAAAQLDLFLLRKKPGLGQCSQKAPFLFHSQSMALLIRNSDRILPYSCVLKLFSAKRFLKKVPLKAESIF